jgi:hypothetical protein
MQPCCGAGAAATQLPAARPCSRPPSAPSITSTPTSARRKALRRAAAGWRVTADARPGHRPRPSHREINGTMGPQALRSCQTSARPRMRPGLSPRAAAPAHLMARSTEICSGPSLVSATLALLRMPAVSTSLSSWPLGRVTCRQVAGQGGRGAVSAPPLPWRSQLSTAQQGAAGAAWRPPPCPIRHAEVQLRTCPARQQLAALARVRSAGFQAHLHFRWRRAAAQHTPAPINAPCQTRHGGGGTQAPCQHSPPACPPRPWWCRSCRTRWSAPRHRWRSAGCSCLQVGGQARAQPHMP